MQARDRNSSPHLPGLAMSQDQLFFLKFAQSWCQIMTDEGLVDSLKTWRHSLGRFRYVIKALVSHVGKCIYFFVQSDRNAKQLERICPSLPVQAMIANESHREMPGLVSVSRRPLARH